jgi:exosortase
MKGIELNTWIGTHINARNMLFIALTAVAVWMVYGPLRDFLIFVVRDKYDTHILLVPLVSGYFIYLERKTIFANLKYSYTFGIPLLMIGVLLYVLGWHQGPRLNQNDYSSLMTFSAIVFWIGGFILSYGIQAFRMAIFPLLFLVFMIPIPTLLVEKMLLVLQAGSTATTYVLFNLTGVPFLKEGSVFHLPGISVEVAKVCSGIRSNLALFITGILAAQLFLKTGSKKIILILLIFPIVITANGIRIVVLSLLGVYVDERALTHGFIHQCGGFSIFIPALALLGLIVWFLRKSELRSGNGDA